MLPDELFGREQDKWEPLIAIADAISVEAGNTALSNRSNGQRHVDHRWTDDIRHRIHSSSRGL